MRNLVILLIASLCSVNGVGAQSSAQPDVTGIAEWRFTWNGDTREVKRGYTIMYSKGGPLGWRVLAVHMGNTR